RLAAVVAAPDEDDLRRAQVLGVLGTLLGDERARELGRRLVRFFHASLDTRGEATSREARGLVAHGLPQGLREAAEGSGLDLELAALLAEVPRPDDPPSMEHDGRDPARDSEDLLLVSLVEEERLVAMP